MKGKGKWGRNLLFESFATLKLSFFFIGAIKNVLIVVLARVSSSSLLCIGSVSFRHGSHGIC